MKIATLSDQYGTGWNGAGDPNDCDIAALEDLAAFAAPRTTDAMAVAYQAVEADHFPRLNVSALPVLQEMGYEPELHWAIFDVDNEDHEPWPSPDDAERALSDAFDTLPVSLADAAGGYTTRAGFRLLWKLDPPLPVGLANSFLRKLGREVTKAGVPVDPTSYEWTRLMRLPRAKRDGVVLDPWVDLAPIEEGLTLDPHGLGFTLTAQELTEDQDLGDAPPEPVVLDWHDLKHAADMPWATQGKAVPADESGSVYRMARTCLGKLAQRGEYTDPHLLASFLWASVLATGGSSLDIGGLWKLACWVTSRQALANAKAADNPEAKPDLPEYTPPTPEEWKLLARAFRGRNSPLLAKLKDGLHLGAHKDRYVGSVCKVLRLMSERTDLPADLLYRAAYASARTQKAPLPDDLWVKCQEVVAERDGGGNDNDKLRRVFVQRYPLTLATPFPGSPLFQLDTTTVPYQYKQTSSDLVEHDFRHHTQPNLPFEADYAGLKVRQILTMYGGRAEGLAYVSGQAGCAFESDTRTMHVGVHQLRPCKAVYHEEVHEWLKLMGGDDVDGLLDWLASVTYTQGQPVCALYLEGGAGIGKSLLAKGVASLWGTQPVDYNAVMTGDFNGQLTSCPLLFADEGIKVERRNLTSASQKFRTVVSNPFHTVRALYRNPSPMQAALRVMVCANPGEEGLPFKESLGAEGIQAIVQRVRYIRANDEAADYLKAVGIESKGAAWAPDSHKPGYIAEHLLWLRDNREVVKAPGQRFLVQGKETTWHREFGAQQGIKPGALQVVFALLQQTQHGVAGGDVYVKNDELQQVVWVNGTTVKKHWDEYARTYRAKPAQVAKALAQLATDRSQVRFAKTGGVRCYGIPYTAFVDAGICDIEDLHEGGA